MDEGASSGRVRYRWSCQVNYSDLAEFLELQRQKAQVAAERDWVAVRFWMASVGTLNDFFLEREYDSLAELAEELLARESDFEFSRLMRASYALVVQGSVRTELFEELNIVPRGTVTQTGRRPAGEPGSLDRTTDPL